jgi:phosphatidylserine/phosphatidylglycerophosphate/cardiolipin synthase-like enzyme
VSAWHGNEENVTNHDDAKHAKHVNDEIWNDVERTRDDENGKVRDGGALRAGGKTSDDPFEAFYGQKAFEEYTQHI